MKLDLDGAELCFRQVSLDDRGFFFASKPRYPHVSCEYNFANLYMWGPVYKILFCEFRKGPLVLIGRDDTLLFPVNQDIAKEDLVRLSRAFSEAGGSGRISQVPGEFLKGNPGLGECFAVESDRDFADYLHLSANLVELSGEKLRKKRNLVSQFRRNHPDAQLCPLEPGCFHGCMGLARQTLDDANPELQDEFQAISRAMETPAQDARTTVFERLGLEGLALQLHGELIAFSVFSPNADGACTVHYEKSDHRYKGAAQLINLATAKSALGRFDYINREQDLGIPGLRQAKLSYDPDLILQNFTLSPLPAG